MIFGMWNPEKIWHQQLIDLPTSPVCCSHFTLGNPKGHFLTSFIHTSDNLRYLIIKWRATVTVQFNHDFLLNVTWTVLSRCVANTRAAASNLQHCWGRACLPARQCTSTSSSWHSRASALWDTQVHHSWYAASQQSWPRSGAWCRSMYTKYQSPIRMSCDSGLLRHKLNFSTVWWTI